MSLQCSSEAHTCQHDDAEREEGHDADGPRREAVKRLVRDRLDVVWARLGHANCLSVGVIRRRESSHQRQTRRDDLAAQRAQCARDGLEAG